MDIDKPPLTPSEKEGVEKISSALSHELRADADEGGTAKGERDQAIKDYKGAIHQLSDGIKERQLDLDSAEEKLDKVKKKIEEGREFREEDLEEALEFAAHQHAQIADDYTNLATAQLEAGTLENVAANRSLAREHFSKAAHQYEQAGDLNFERGEFGEAEELYEAAATCYASAGNSKQEQDRIIKKTATITTRK